VTELLYEGVIRLLLLNEPYFSEHVGTGYNLRRYWHEIHFPKMLTSSIRTLARAASHVPILSKLRLNFISFHYVYIISWMMVASLIICPHGDIRYIDALFLASNAATQGGLNTVDLNALHIYQQITLCAGSKCGSSATLEA
jgi:hypothetical protein